MGREQSLPAAPRPLAGRPGRRRLAGLLGPLGDDCDGPGPGWVRLGDRGARRRRERRLRRRQRRRRAAAALLAEFGGKLLDLSVDDLLQGAAKPPGPSRVLGEDFHVLGGQGVQQDLADAPRSILREPEDGQTLL